MQICILFCIHATSVGRKPPYSGPGMHKDCLAITQNAGRLLLHEHNYQHPSSQKT